MQNKNSAKLLVGAFMIVSCLRMASASEVTGTLSSNGNSNPNPAPTVSASSNTASNNGGFVIPNLSSNSNYATPQNSGVVLGAATYNPPPKQNTAPAYRASNLNPIVRGNGSAYLAQNIATETPAVVEETPTDNLSQDYNSLAIADTATPAEFTFLGFGLTTWAFILIGLALLLALYIYNEYQRQNTRRGY